VTYLNVDTAPGFTPIPVPITDRFASSDGTPIRFDRVISDSGGHWGGAAHPDVVCKGGSTGYIAHGVLSFRMEDFTTGSEFQVWQIEYDSGWDIVEVDWSEEEYAPLEHDLLPRTDPAHDISVKHFRFPVFSYVNPGHYLAFRITQFHDTSTYVDADGVTRDYRIGVVARAKATLQIGPK
jgi:hypothetical protein